MKIITVVWSIGIGGTERAAVNYAIGYKQFMHDSKVLVLGEGHDRYPDLKEAGVDTQFSSESDPLQSQIVFNELKNWSPDIIHVHNYNSAILPYLERLKADHTKIVETNVFSRPYFDESYKAVDLSMQLSAWGYWKYCRLSKSASYVPQVAMIPYIVDDTKFRQPTLEKVGSFLDIHQIKRDAFIIGRIGQPHPSKWDTRIVDVINRTIRVDNNIYYLLVGVPADIIKVIERQTIFFKSRVKVIEKIEGDTNLSLYYHSLSCFAHISKIGESFGYVLAEALVCRVPVITLLTPLKDNAQFELVGDQYGGFCVTNIKEFVEAILNLYNNKPVFEKIKVNLDGWIEKRFSWQQVIPGLIVVYQDLLSGKKIAKENVSDLVNRVFDIYRKKNYMTLLFSKLVNTSGFYKLTVLIKKMI